MQADIGFSFADSVSFSETKSIDSCRRIRYNGDIEATIKRKEKEMNCHHPKCLNFVVAGCAGCGKPVCHSHSTRISDSNVKRLCAGCRKSNEAFRSNSKTAGLNQIARMLGKAVHPETLGQAMNDLLVADDNDQLSDVEAELAQDLLVALTEQAPEATNIATSWPPHDR